MNKVIEQLMKDNPGTTNFSAKGIKAAAKAVGKSWCIQLGINDAKICCP